MPKAILLAEDDKADAEFFQRVLKKTGVINPVIQVSDGDEAIAYLNGDGEFSDRHKFPMPGILFVDLRMPRKDGFQVLKWIKRSHVEDLLVVVLSAHHELGEIPHAYALGAHSFLMKPCIEEDIANLMKTFPGYWRQAPVHIDKTPNETVRAN